MRVRSPLEDLDSMVHDLVHPMLDGIAHALYTKHQTAQDTFFEATETRLLTILHQSLSLEMLFRQKRVLLNKDALASQDSSESLRVPGWNENDWLHLYELLPEAKRLVDVSIQDGLEFSRNVHNEVDESFPLLQLGSSTDMPAHRLSVAGDFHGPRATVTRLEVADGRCYYLKSANENADTFLRQSIELLGSHVSETLALPTSRYFGSTVWQEEVEDRSTLTNPFSAGVLQAFAYFFRFVDLHGENVIPADDKLYIVDAECLFSPRPTGGRFGDLRVETHYFREDSLEESCILPYRMGGSLTKAGANWSLMSGSRLFDSSSFPRSMVENKDDGSVKIDFRVEVDAAYDSRAKAEVEWIAESSSEFLKGLREGLLKISEKRDDVLGLLQSYTGDSRVLFRATQTYADLLWRSFHPSLLVSRERRHDYLRNELSKTVATGDSDALVDLELAELMDGRIPRFVCDVNSTDFAGIPLWGGPEISGRRLQRAAADDIPRLLELARIWLASYIASFDDGVVSVPDCLRV